MSLLPIWGNIFERLIYNVTYEFLSDNNLLLQFDNRPVKPTPIHKHLGMMLDSNLSYEHRIKSISNKTVQEVNKTIGFSRKFQLILPRHSLITICKTFIWPRLNHGDVI